MNGLIKQLNARNAIRVEKIASPPPPGHAYRCKECGEGCGFDSDRICVVCRFC
jgi:hypothetical protein